ncbi:MAG: O-antigen ligase family protein [Pseudanabaenaceae cyanobacterium bins.39]|nr:O-antigen ligase family protein [Pseudanabaenaceae cyanobacterium bins.39]
MRTGRLIVQLGIAAYIVFTVLPDSSTQMVSFPWVLLWQLGLLCLTIAGLLNLWQWHKPFFLLGNGLDWVIGSSVVSLSLSTIGSEFSQQSMWYSLIAFGYFAALYTVNNFLHIFLPLSYQVRLPKLADASAILPILRFQGLLGLVVIIESLGLWFLQSWLPQMQKFSQLRQWGLNLTYDFVNLESRNWVPMGHQNYVAGFLILVLPLFVGLAIAQSGMWRKLWLGAIALDLVDLYTTSSRGGFLALGAMVVYGVAIAIWQWRRYRHIAWFGGGVAIAGLSIFIAVNNRLRLLITGLVNSWGNPIQGGGELLFRAITMDVGWRIGLEHWLFGAGAGSVAMLFQKYRPQWAGREAEMVYQLHSTPAQLWAELGMGFVIIVLCLLVAIASLWIKLHRSPVWAAHPQDRPFAYALFASLGGYGVMAITDYQLDVPAIAGSLVIVLACLAYLGQVYTGDLVTLGSYRRPRFWLATVATGYLIAAIVWLLPVNRAWQSANVGFMQLDRARTALVTAKPEEVNTVIPEAIALIDKFTERLATAQKLAPWQPYYAYQLGWNLGELATNPEFSRLPQTQRQQWQQASLEWLRMAIAANPYSEAMYNAPAWLSLPQGKLTEAEAYFRKGLELVPLKRSLSFGLGLSLLQQRQVDQGITAMATEVINDPEFITSPVWLDPSLQRLYPQLYTAVINQVERQYMEEMQKLTVPSPYLSLRLAVLRWWTGKFSSTQDLLTQFQASNNSAAILLAQAIANDTNALSNVLQNPQTPLEMAIAAWFNPERRQQWLEQAYVFATSEPMDEQSAILVKAMGDRMAQSRSFDEWLRLPVNSPLVRSYRRARLGFGAISRQVDGVIPLDFFNVSENVLVSSFLKDIFP